MKTILITGATAGIGRHAALELVRQGHHVIATGRNPRQTSAIWEEVLKKERVGVTDDFLAEKYDEVGEVLGNDYVVKSGVKPGDRLIVGGIQKIGDGAPVKPE